MSPLCRSRPCNHMLTHSAIEMEEQPRPSACQRAYWKSCLEVSPWVVVPLKEPFEFKPSQSMALSYIYSLDSDQIGSFRVYEQEQNTACENTRGNESLIEFHASYTFFPPKNLYVCSVLWPNVKLFYWYEVSLVLAVHRYRRIIVLHTAALKLTN